MVTTEYLSYQYLYKTKGWQVRRLWQLHREPYCRVCVRLGRATVATVADHVTPHRGNKRLFWDRNNLQSLCHVHHNEKTNQEQGHPARQAIGADGWPIDNNTPGGPA